MLQRRNGEKSDARVVLQAVRNSVVVEALFADEGSAAGLKLSFREAAEFRGELLPVAQTAIQGLIQIKYFSAPGDMLVAKLVRA